MGPVLPPVGPRITLFTIEGEKMFPSKRSQTLQEKVGVWREGTRSVTLNV